MVVDHCALRQIGAISCGRESACLLTVKVTVKLRMRASKASIDAGFQPSEIIEWAGELQRDEAS